MKKLSEIVSTGRMVGSTSSAFRNTSTSKPDDLHDRSGHDVGAARNYAHEKAAVFKANAAKRERERKIEDRTRKAEQRAKDTLRMAKESVEASGTVARVKIKNVARPDDANPASEKSLLSKNGEIKMKKVEEEIADSISRKYGLTDSLIAASRAIMEKKTKVDLDPETDDKINDDDDDVKKESKHTTPKSDKEKKLAALAHPKDKITHKDVLVGRGVLKKEEVEPIDELKKSTLASYIKKASDDATYHAFDAGRHYDTNKKEKYAASDRNTLKRQAGVKMAVDKLTKEETETPKSYSKYEMSYEKGVSDESHNVVNKHLDLTKSPLYQKGEQVTTPQRLKKLVHSHPDHKEMKDRGFRIKKYGEHSDSLHGKTTNEEVEQIDELKHSGIISRYMHKVKQDVDSGTASPKRKAGYNLALKKKWGDKRYGMEEPRVRATAEEFSDDELVRLENIAAKFNIKETSTERDLQDHEPRIVSGVKGMKSKPFSKKFPHQKAMEKWMDSDDYGNHDVHRIERA